MACELLSQKWLWRFLSQKECQSHFLLHEHLSSVSLYGLNVHEIIQVIQVLMGRAKNGFGTIGDALIYCQNFRNFLLFSTV